MSRFGRLMRKEFLLEPLEAAFLNHGSKGAVPKVVQRQKIRYLNEMESHPGIWSSKTHRELWKLNLHAVASYVGSRPQNLTFVMNATTGVNTVLKSLDFKPRDCILTCSYTHKNVKKTCENIARRTGAHVVTLELCPPIESVEYVVDKYETCLRNHPNIKLVILDYISSVPPLKMPVEQLIPLFRKYGVLILVDGAHAPGQVNLNLEELGADFFTGNLYKWMFVPRGSAILWSRPEYHHVITPLSTSAYLGSKETFEDFIWLGTVDYSSHFCATKAIEFIDDIGGLETYMSYCSSLADEAAESLVEIFGTHKFQVPLGMEAPNMRLIKAPPISGVPVPKEIKGDPYSTYGHLPLFLPFWERFMIHK